MEDVKADLVEVAEAALEEIVVHVKSMKQLVLNAARNAKCRSNQAVTGRSIARTASGNEEAGIEAEVETGISFLCQSKNQRFLFFFFYYNFPLTKLAKELACKNIR